MGVKMEISSDGLSFRYTDTPRAERTQKGISVIDLVDDYIVIDVETTGLDADFCDIIEISAFKVKNGLVVDKFSSLVRPAEWYVIDDDYEDDYEDGDYIPFSICSKSPYVDDFITKLTGITNEMLEKAPLIENILPEFKNFIGNNVLLGHNVNFDINFLYNAFIDVLNEPLRNNFIDTMRFSRKLFQELQHHRLCDTAAACLVEYKNAHRAENDCEITYACFEKMKSIIAGNYASFSDFKKLFTSGGRRIDVAAIAAESAEFDDEHPLYRKMVVFTGTLSNLVRKDAMQLVVNVGGTVSNNITMSTNYLVVGSTDFAKSVKGGKSSKMKKADNMKLDGCDINVISENMFISLLENK